LNIKGDGLDVFPPKERFQVLSIGVIEN